MPAPSGSLLHFSCSFTLAEKVGEKKDWSDLVESVRSWLRNSDLRREIRDPSFLTGGSFRSNRKPRTYVETAQSKAADGYITWGIRYEHPCAQVIFRQWRTDLVFEQTSEGIYHVSLEVHNWLLPNYIGAEPERPMPTAPRIVRSLMEDRHWLACAGSETLESGPEILKIGGGKDFAARLTNPNRTCPIVWITHHPDTKAPTVDPAQLAKLLCGTAKVCVPANPTVEEELRWVIPTDLTVRAGGIRIYQPVVDFSDPASYRRHRFIPRSHVDEFGEAAVFEMVVRGIARRPRAFGAHYSTSIDDIARKRRELRLAELKTHADANQAEWVRVLEEDNNALSTENAGLKAELGMLEEQAVRNDDQLQELRADLDSRRNDIQSVRAEAQSLRSQLELAEQKLEIINNFRQLPTTVPEVIRSIELMFPDRIFFTQAAIASAEEATFELIPVAWECLWAMATVLHELHFAGSRSTAEIEQQLKERTGFDLSFTEGKLTKSNKKLMRLRQVEYKGEVVEILPHVKYGTRPPKCFRVHYHPHQGEKLIVVGYCGDHMDTASTRRRN